MTTCQAVADVLDETIKALVSLDLESLQLQAKRVSVLAQSNLIADEAGVASVLEKKRVLELVLHGSASNLNALNRLYRRNTRDSWER
jgi:hypothetical protein